MYIFLIIFQALFLVSALSLDAFACAFGYGASKIKIPLKSIVVINIICSALLAVGLYLGSLLALILTEELTGYISFAILFILGLSKLFDSFIKSRIRRKNGINKELKLKIFSLDLLLKIYADPEIADIDFSKSLNIKEALPLAFALGIDGLSVGIGIGLTMINPILIVGLSVITGILVTMLGAFLGVKVASKLKFDISWIAGVVLIIIAILDLV